MIIEQPAKWLRWLYPKALWRMDETDHSVYLTFDDGPIPESTPYILKTLREFNVKATFFVVGDNVRKYPELFQQILADGHCVGNHTFNHISSARHSIREYETNIRQCEEIMMSLMHNQQCITSNDDSDESLNPSDNSSSFILHPSSSAKPLFRPPHGWMRLSEYNRLAKMYRIVMWDLVTRDYSHLLSAYDVVRNVHQYARNGSIITFHDSLKSIDKLYFALPSCLRFLRSQGFDFKTFE